MTRIFKKPDLGKKERESYLASLDEKILLSERRLVDVVSSVEASIKVVQETFLAMQASKHKEIKELEGVLTSMRAEKASLEKPLTEREKAISERESVLKTRELELEEKEQSLFEKEHDCESRLESVRDLSDQIGEARTRVSIKETQLKRKEHILSDHERDYLIKVESFNRQVTEKAKELDARGYQIGIQELNIHSKEENLTTRERELLNGHIRLNDQREVLGKAWKELKNKTKHHG